jgi:hypothetical protein
MVDGYRDHSDTLYCRRRRSGSLCWWTHFHVSLADIYSLPSPLYSSNSNREQPSWDSGLGFVALGLLSVTMGLQGIVGKVSWLYLCLDLVLIP